MGQFERDLIQQRTRAGLSAAAARGRKGGRKPVVTGEELERARGLGRVAAMIPISAQAVWLAVLGPFPLSVGSS